ncbi:alpha/beta hydrolase family protein [Arthrobacter sp. H14-L1]|uniref:alpha/beta hydrolase family protein n=1 Tax=Arthrobacter sp. H14-L1 TaxID=2996697 RepID=UPI00226F3AD7|nr:prolyl oligopeptidase family serine peptidase [Arthrobacter sp. H14-L1]MCY0904332.1 alpha/beta fold hydrolase [Arthrobacter sp. H14-L1]
MPTSVQPTSQPNRSLATDLARRGQSALPVQVPAPSAWLKWTIAGVGIGAGAGSVLLTATAALAAYFARRVVTPAKEREQDLAILAVIRDGMDLEVVLPATAETTVPGTYSLFFDGGAGHAVIGGIRSYVPREGTVTREVLRVSGAELGHASRGWWSSAVFAGPGDVGLAAEDVILELPVGPAPAWLFRSGAGHSTWAIMVHGRGATRNEGLRAVRTAHDLGLNSLVMSYRNDGEAPAAGDGRYGLGATEWPDVEAAIEYALSQGAKDVVLFGYSMGGAIALQTADLSKHRNVILALVLDAPVISWVDVLAHQAELNKIPAAVGQYGQLMLSHPLGRRLTGLAAPVDLKSMDWVARAVELRTPTLIIHSVDDDFVPYGPSAELALRNPEMVTLETFSRALHTKEWNVDPQRWEAVVADWLQPRLGRHELPRTAGPGA